MAKKTKQIPKQIIAKQTFDSIYHFCRHVQRETGPGHHSRQYPRSKGFCNVTFDEWIESIEDGKIADYDNFDFKLREASIALRRYYSRDIVGQFHDIGELLAGAPDSAFVCHRQRSTFNVSIYVSTAVSVVANEAPLKSRAIAALALAEMIESTGGTVTMYAVCAGQFRNYDWDYKIKSLTPKEFYSAIQPSTMRRGGFAYLESVTGLTHCNGYGYPKCVVEIDSDINSKAQQGDVILTMDSNENLVSSFSGDVLDDIGLIFDHSSPAIRNDNFYHFYKSICEI